jgi:steroid 5-alpha reductase family enzyme
LNFGHFSSRLVLMTILVTIWGLRLTYNFSRHGAYRWKFWSGKEDYRWEILREKKEFQPRWKWSLFNLFFISGYQNILILLFTLPAIVTLQFNTRPLGNLDYLAAFLMLSLIIFETIADQQQWKYQHKKWSLIRSGQPLHGDYKKGFQDKGLWSLSRHPNYFAEQGIWISFYLFSVAASGQLFNWTLAGCLLLVILFQGSTAFTEEISLSKYPQYAAYQERVPKLIPLGEKRAYFSRLFSLDLLTRRKEKE